MESAKNTASGPLEILVYLDSDDPLLKDYDVEAIIGEPKMAGEAIRAMIPLAKGDMYYFGSDDQTWKTQGWDEIFRENMPEHGLSVLFPSLGDAINPVFTDKWVEMVGLFPEYFRHFGPDTWYVDIARRAGQLKHVPEVRMDHKRQTDATYNRIRAGEDGTFATKKLDETRQEREELAQKIKTFLS